MAETERNGVKQEGCIQLARLELGDQEVAVVALGPQRQIRVFLTDPLQRLGQVLGPGWRPHRPTQRWYGSA